MDGRPFRAHPPGLFAQVMIAQATIAQTMIAPGRARDHLPTGFDSLTQRSEWEPITRESLNAEWVHRVSANILEHGGFEPLSDAERDASLQTMLAQVGRGGGEWLKNRIGTRGSLARFGDGGNDLIAGDTQDDGFLNGPTAFQE